MSNFLARDTPNFVFKGKNAALDFGLIIASELPVITPFPNIEEIKILGRSRTLTEWHGDYEPYDYPVNDISVPFEQLQAVQRWLRGSGQLITHNDVEKYVEAKANISAPVEYTNEWGLFYVFNIIFRCQPFKFKANERFINLKTGNNAVMDYGMEIAHPYFEIESNGGNITVAIGDRELTISNTYIGLLTIDTESGVIIQPDNKLLTKGNYPLIYPGENNIRITGDFSSAKIKLRSVWL